MGLEMSGSVAAFNQHDRRHAQRRQDRRCWASRPGDTKMDMNKVICKGLTLQGIYGRKMYETWYKMITMVRGRPGLTPMITHRFHYTRFRQGLRSHEQRQERQGSAGLDKVRESRIEE